MSRKATETESGDEIPRASSKEISKTISKSELTKTRILDAALAIFQERGFEKATMREIAERAGVATGAAYYYFDSKDALVMAFYQRAQQEMRPELEKKLARARTLETRLRALIEEKLEYFAANRKLLGALSAHVDPEHPLSPFSQETAAIRDSDIVFFQQAVDASAVKLPREIAPYLPRLLWLYQMGLILFWVYDRSPDQRRTRALFEGTLKMLLLTLRLASVPLLRPMHRFAADLLRVIYEKE